LGSLNRIWENKFIIHSFIGKIDSYQCKKKHYIQILEKFCLNNRIDNNLVGYAIKKKVISPNNTKENVHFITIFKSKKIFSLRNMEGYQISTNESEVSMPIKNERKNIENEINYLRRKVDRFRIKKEKFANMKEFQKYLILTTLNRQPN
jgi:hypothetical protein